MKYFLSITKGQNCWVVLLANVENRHNWIVLDSFPTSIEAERFAKDVSTLEIAHNVV